MADRLKRSLTKSRPSSGVESLPYAVIGNDGAVIETDADGPVEDDLADLTPNGKIVAGVQFFVTTVRRAMAVGVALALLMGPAFFERRAKGRARWQQQPRQAPDQSKGRDRRLRSWASVIPSMALHRLLSELVQRRRFPSPQSCRHCSGPRRKGDSPGRLKCPRTTQKPSQPPVRRPRWHPRPFADC